MKADRSTVDYVMMHVILKLCKNSIHNKVVGDSIIDHRLWATSYHMGVYSVQVNSFLNWLRSFAVAHLTL